MRGECVHAGAERLGATDDPTTRYVSLCWCPFCGSIAVDGKWRAPAVLADHEAERKALVERLWGHAESVQSCAEDLRAALAAARSAAIAPKEESR